MNNTNDSLESVKRIVKKIKRSGVNVEVFGAVLILFGGGLVWFSHSKSSVVIRFLIFAILGLYFILTGIYIKSGMGRWVKYVLLANAIVSFPLCVGILPIYICVQSANNFNRYNELPDNVKELYSKRRLLRFKTFDIILVAVVLLAGFVSAGMKIYKINQNNSKNKAAAASIQSGNFSSSTYTFAIKFPSAPAQTDFTEQESGHTVNYSTFITSADHGAQEYEVYAYSWPSQYYNFDKLTTTALTAAVNNGLNTIVQTNNATSVTSNDSTFMGHVSDYEQFTAPTFGSTTTGYVRVFYIGNTEYGILTRGASISQFNNFANTFQYTGKNS